MGIVINPDFPIGPAAGYCKKVENVWDLGRSAASFITIGSVTLEPRSGNPGNTWDGQNLNSLGLPNPGVDYYLQNADSILKVGKLHNKPIIVSIAGFTTGDYKTLVSKLYRAGYNNFELNLGCPNVVEGESRKPIFSFDKAMMERILNEFSIIRNEDHKEISFGSVKVSPMTDPNLILDMAKIVSNKNIEAVVTQNTVPNSLLFKADGFPVIDTPDKTGWAGLAGPSIKAIAMGQVSQWRSALDQVTRTLGEKKDVWGAGGVSGASDVVDMQIAGAKVVQIGTAYFATGPRIFSEIAMNFLKSH